MASYFQGKLAYAYNAMHMNVMPIYGKDNYRDIFIFRLHRAERNILHVVAIFPDPILKSLPTTYISGI